MAFNFFVSHFYNLTEINGIFNGRFDKKKIFFLSKVVFRQFYFFLQRGESVQNL